MPGLERALRTLDATTLDRLRPALAWLGAEAPGSGGPDLERLRRFLWRELPVAAHTDDREPHEVAWTDLPPIYWKAFGIALLLGMVTAIGWIVWKLFEANVLR